MTDSEIEMLRLAAQAAGYEFTFTNGRPIVRHPDGGLRVWNPLEYSGQALELAAALGLVVDCSRPSAGVPYKPHAVYVDELCDTLTLIRRAITRAAAATVQGDAA